MSGQVVVVTGTGTDIGKTIATSALAACLIADGLAVAAVKPAQTGLVAGEPGDLDVVRALGGVDTLVEPVRLPDPLAPDTAARVAGMSLPDLRSTAARVMSLATQHDVVLVEGAGGLLVRLDAAGSTIADLAAAVQEGNGSVHVVVVVAPGLGTLNHTELTVEALRSRGLEPAGLIVGSWPANLGLAERCNLGDLGRLGVPLLGRIPAGVGSMESGRFRCAAPTWLPDVRQVLFPR